MYNRDALLRELRSNIIEVHFNKVDGTLRKMRCTLQPLYLPEVVKNDPQQLEEEKTFHKTNPDVLAVWDIEANGWRSFRVDSVVYTEAVDVF